MDALTIAEAANYLGVKTATVKSWRYQGLLPAFVDPSDGRGSYLYPTSFIYELKTANGPNPLLVEFVRLFRLAWDYNHGDAAHRQTAWQTISQLRDNGTIVNAAQMARMIGYGASSVTEWAQQGRIPSVYLNARLRLLTRTHALELVRILNGYTVIEAAQILHASSYAIRLWIKSGKLPAVIAPNGEWRLELEPVDRLAASQPQLDTTMDTRQVVARLRVPMHQVKMWCFLDLLPYTVVNARRRFPISYIVGLARFANGRTLTRKIVTEYHAIQTHN
jgi:predicted site-specific integrase-resolvase